MASTQDAGTDTKDAGTGSAATGGLSLKVDLAKDTATVGDKVTGLDRVLVQGATAVAIDDVADLVLDAARAVTPDGAGHHYVIHVVTDAAVLEAIDSYRVLDAVIRTAHAQLEGYLQQYASEQRAARDRLKRTSAAAADGSRWNLVQAVPAVASFLTESIGLFSRLTAHDYQLSGKEVEPGVLGMDLLVARLLTAKAAADESVEVTVERMTPTGGADIVARLTGVADLSIQVSHQVAAAAERQAVAEAEVKQLETQLVALDAEILELVKKAAEAPAVKSAASKKPAVPAKPTLLERREEERRAAAAQHDVASTEAASAAAMRQRGTELVTAMKLLVTDALTPPAAGGRPPLLRAARAERFVGDGPGPYLLHVGLVAAGIDQTIDTRLGPDRWTVIAGAAVEFALLRSDGRIVTSGVRPVYSTATATLSKPSETFKRGTVDYQPIVRKKP